MTLQTHFDYDFIVIGSGFGGSVSALRLAQKGYKTAIIEKGKRWQNKDFPKTNWNLKKYLWFPQAGCYGYQMLTQLKHVMILHGSGVGGGSLVYANQLLVPPDDVFDNPGWGIADCKNTLMPHYEAARKMLGANPSPSVGAADKCLREVGIQMRGKDTFHKNDVGVFFGTPKESVPDPYFDGEGPDRVGCDFCGACMIGCPSGAKNTLDKNYLYLAEKLGVDIIPETEVTGVTPGKEGYEIFTRQTPGIFKSKKTFTTRGAVFSGGVMGTVKLLMKCRHQGLLPKLPDQLGHQVRTNSEVLLGVKSRDKKTDWNNQIAITSGIYPDDTTHIEMVRYNKGSDTMLLLLSLLTGGGGKIPRFLRYLGNIVRHPVEFIKLLWPFDKAASTSVVLVMQTDDNFLTLDYKPRWWRLGRHSVNSVIPKGTKGMKAFIPIANDVTKKLAKKMDGIPLSYIAESIFNSGSTAHILGGCCMGDSPDNGVVGKNGEIFGYPNLFIADGSVVPVNLGVNPSLTITALSEYIMSQMPKKEDQDKKFGEKVSTVSSLSYGGNQMNSPTHPPDQKISAQGTLDSLKEAYRKKPVLTFEERSQTLIKMEQILTDNEHKICEAICKDFGNRSYHESKMLEIATSILGIRDVRKHLKKWIKPQKRHVSMIFMGGKNRVIPQAKGIIGIISPWNYPLFLTMSPLTSAIAAGNRVMIKMASNSQNLCRLLQEKFSKLISEEIVTFLPGVAASEFSTLPFDHLIFTGSPGVGKTIMQSAAKNLTPVTLELGGKSPAILLDDFDIKTAANRIMSTKLMNAGQTCVAPDYLFVPENKLNAFIDHAKTAVAKLYKNIQTKDYTAIIDQRAYARLLDTISDAKEKGAQIIQLIPGNVSDEKNLKISPMIMKDVAGNMTVMQKEIFGPILPIMTYSKINEVVDYVNDHERPLAIYLFTNQAQDQEYIIANTLSGGVTVNDCAMHVGQHDLPFGGVGNSGMGQYHGYEGFLEFSKLRPVFKQSKWPVAITPPYGKPFDYIYNSILKFKWLK